MRVVSTTRSLTANLLRRAILEWIDFFQGCYPYLSHQGVEEHRAILGTRNNEGNRVSVVSNSFPMTHRQDPNDIGVPYRVHSEP